MFHNTAPAWHKLKAIQRHKVSELHTSESRKQQSLRSKRRRSDASSPWWQSKTTLNAPARLGAAAATAVATLSSHMPLLAAAHIN